MKMIDSQITNFRKNFGAMRASLVHTLIPGSSAPVELDRFLIRASQLESDKVIGKGSFGEVHKSRYRGAFVAVKTIHKIDKENLERFQEEVRWSEERRAKRAKVSVVY